MKRNDPSVTLTHNPRHRHPLAARIGSAVLAVAVGLLALLLARYLAGIVLGGL